MASKRLRNVLCWLVVPAVVAAAVVLLVLFRSGGHDPEWYLGVHPPTVRRHIPHSAPDTRECVLVTHPTLGRGSDQWSRGYYQKQSWRHQGKEVWYLPKARPWHRDDGFRENQERFLYVASDGGWVLSGLREDMANDAGYFRSAPANNTVPVFESTGWMWGDGTAWHTASFHVQSTSCPSDRIGDVSAPGGNSLRPYLALFETTGATSGVLPRDTAGGGVEGTMKWRMLSKAKPRALYVENFADDRELEAVLSHARSSLQRSAVVAVKPSDQVSSVRTSHGMFLTPSQMLEPDIDVMRRRVARIAQLPLENIEATQVLRYTDGQQYYGHPDYFDASFQNHLARGGQRVASAVSWLNDVSAGGHTDFPRRPELSVAPKKGDLLLFYDTDSEGRPDPFSEHAGRPPKHDSVKWVQVFWIRERRFE